MVVRERRLKVVGMGGTLREGSASLGALAADGEAGADEPNPPLEEHGSGAELVGVAG